MDVGNRGNAAVTPIIGARILRHMHRKRTASLFLLFAGIALAVLGALKGTALLHLLSPPWDQAFSVVDVRGAGGHQQAYFLSAPAGAPKPLLVSLHTWSGDYRQIDPLAKRAKDNAWNYIHPDLGGPNTTKTACLSKSALLQIDDAIQYGKTHGNTDPRLVFVVGVSGGGYATLGAFLSTSHRVRSFQAWAPISNLAAWFSESDQYRKDVLACTSEGASLDEKAAMQRSPLFMPIPIKANGHLEIYAGINDGHTGSVPISHSLNFFNRVADHYGHGDSKVSPQDFASLLRREMQGGHSSIEGRRIIYRRDNSVAALVVFDGGHELLQLYSFERMKQLALATAPAAN